MGALGIASGQTSLRTEGERGLGAERPGPGYLALLHALESARRGTAGPAADSVLAAEPAILEEQPAARAITRFWHARHLTRTGNAEAALRLLRWAEHHDVVGELTGAPMASELDWAFGPLARVLEAELLQGRRQDTARLCRVLAAIAADWAHGAGPFAERATRAREQFTVLACGRPS
jgi:hypothetical protein